MYAFVQKKETEMKRLFTSESVTEGHPDKICDQISDAIVDAILAEDPVGRVAAETTVNTGYAMIMGEITTECYVDIPKIARQVIVDIGYDRAKYGFDGYSCAIMTSIDEQSPDIALGVNESTNSEHDIGAGDELYISWEDAVANSYDRYCVVIDNYRSGVYGRRDPIRGSFMQSQGELMQLLGDIENARKDLVKNAEELADDIDMSLRSARNRALTDVISAGYEVSESIKNKRREALSDLESLLDEVSQSFWDRKR